MTDANTSTPDVRSFNYASTLLDDSTWPACATTGFDPDTGRGIPVPVPNGWPDPLSLWIWDRPSWDPGVPPGVVFFRRWLTMPSDGWVEVWMTADDEAEAWWDGAKILDQQFATGFPNTKITLWAPGGPHLLAFRGQNDNDLKAGLQYTVLRLDAGGTPLGIVARSDAATLCLGYPLVAPGFTIGQIIRLLLQEAQHRGVLLGVQLGFDDHADTGGRPWPPTTEVQVQVGHDYLTVLKQLASSDIDLAMDPVDLRLYAWNKGTRGTARGAALLPGVNLTELTHTGRS